MNIKIGQRRVVIIISVLGVVIKLPIIHLLRDIGMVCKHIVHWRIGAIISECAMPIDCRFGYKNHLFGGIVDNWREFVFFRKTKHPFLLPTYFSFFGLLNIQRAGEPCQLKDVDLWCQLYELTDGKVFDDSHHFENPANFVLEGRRLRMIDYGSIRTHGVITQYGKKIVETFDPSFDWEEKKKALRAQKK